MGLGLVGGAFISDQYLLPHLHGLSVIHWTFPNTHGGALISYHIPWAGHGEKGDETRTEKRERKIKRERKRETEKKSAKSDYTATVLG